MNIFRRVAKSYFFLKNLEKLNIGIFRRCFGKTRVCTTIFGFEVKKIDIYKFGAKPKQFGSVQVGSVQAPLLYNVYIIITYKTNPLSQRPFKG